MKYLDFSGLSRFWNKIKSYFSELDQYVTGNRGSGTGVAGVGASNTLLYVELNKPLTTGMKVHIYIPDNTFLAKESSMPLYLSISGDTENATPPYYPVLEPSGSAVLGYDYNGKYIELYYNGSNWIIIGRESNSSFKVNGNFAVTGTVTTNSDATIKGDVVVNNIRTKNILNPYSFVKGRLENGVLAKQYGTTSITATDNSISFTTNIAWNSGATSGFIPVTEGSYTYTATSDKKVYYYIDTYNSSKGWIARLVSGNHTGAGTNTFSVGNTVAYIRLHYEVDGVNTYTITNLQIERGSTATAFTPHQNLNVKEDDTGWDTITPSVGSATIMVRKIGSIVNLYIFGDYGVSLANNSTTTFATIPARYRPSSNIIAPCVLRNASGTEVAQVALYVNSDGGLRVRQKTGSAFVPQQIFANLTYFIG